MPKTFIKTKDCGCIVMSLMVGIEPTNNGNIYLLGGHNHITICNTCKECEENEDDTLYGMWKNDNITDAFGYAGWKVNKEK